eukprot:CAMPEP_0202688510 /NCGR_PEP_ID=MMETSP1385-20130828/4015_1 /ASSEMBLY_ACC=CAM_ASM_000861 /TAXON_ID=933848 /ORGANISM="Elphidium margaritaceum" /LENGTH=296 /DNA_ID=CAMNT_0049343503 /DNA_START=40 /DNA_END=930 /DNA_ORIENTATION=+
MDIDAVSSDRSLTAKYFCDASKKYFWTYPFWSQGIYLKQSENREMKYMDDTAVRARAGLLNLLGYGVLLCSFLIPQYMVIIYVGPLIAFDMAAGCLFGLTPFCPTGVLGTIITWKLAPVYKPSAPKRFAWAIGIMLAIFCISWRLTYGPHWILKATIGLCLILTALESSLGFCLGCWIYGHSITTMRRLTSIYQNAPDEAKAMEEFRPNPMKGKPAKPKTGVDTIHDELVAIKSMMNTLADKIDIIDRRALGNKAGREEQEASDDNYSKSMVEEIPENQAAAVAEAEVKPFNICNE